MLIYNLFSSVLGHIFNLMLIYLFNQFIFSAEYMPGIVLCTPSTEALIRSYNEEV